ncbi:hypothetical protein, partial [Corynebacterium sp. LK2510]|uniref:hypothetical protein n=1 Tax=Corynebacterium sp. LK2510 TaxID=3110472 RepID=UPI0034D00AAD
YQRHRVLSSFKEARDQWSSVTHIIRYRYRRKLGKSEEENNGETDDSTHPYVRIVALLPLIDEVEGSGLEPAETAELREQLRATLTPYLPEDPQVILGDQSLEEFLASHPVASLNATEILACLKVFHLEAQMMGGGYLHHRITGGEIGPLLRRLGDAGQDG